VAQPPTSLPPSPENDALLSEEARLRAEHKRLVRERWMHLLLLGFALSIVFHAVIMLRLWWIKLPDRAEESVAAVELRLQELPPPVEDPPAEVELPDPNPKPVGPVTTEIDPIPNLSLEDASDNPNENSFGALEAPGVGAIVGPGGPAGGIGIGSGKGGGGTSFFGVGGRGSRFAYVVDVSGSMGQEGRILTAMAELKRSISALPDYTQFYVVLYDNNAIFPDWDTLNWYRATRANVARMREWLDQQGPRGGTYPINGFRRVFDLPQRPDVIFFLTDGEIPPDTPDLVDQLVSGGKDKNSDDIVINTIGFSSEAGKEPLIQLAKRNRGVFRFVPTSGVRMSTP
jgi:hypothetical protein